MTDNPLYDIAIGMLLMVAVAVGTFGYVIAVFTAAGSLQ